jgi:hypothetical protein
MRSIIRPTAMGVGIAVLICSFLPSTAVSQSSTSQPSTTIHTQLPRNNVLGGTIAAGRPGLWIQRGNAAAVTRQQSALHAFGGAKITATQPASIKDTVLPELVNIFLAAIQSLATAINAAITAASATGT